jgi:Ca2+-binding RTX toxin-like protein
VTLRLRRFWTILGTIAALALALPAAASAADCSMNNSSPSAPPVDGPNDPALLDSGGYEFDVSQEGYPVPTYDDEAEPFATLFDGGAETTTVPPGPRSEDDSWDSWGALYVGPGGDTNVLNQYFSTNDESCLREDDGRELVFPALPLSGLTVQRKLFVAASGLHGARLLNLVSNRGKTPVTTTVQIGTRFSFDNYGDLGSDDDTAVRVSSSGDLVLTPADFWAVTSDNATTNDDPALGHVMDGPGGRERVDLATLLGLRPPGEDGDPEDNLTWAWNVTVQPGQTLALMSYEIQQSLPVDTDNAAAEAGMAAGVAQSYQGAPPTTLFAGMTKSEQAAVANWKTPVNCLGRPVTIAGTDGADKIVGTKKPDVIFAGGGKDTVKGKKGNDRMCGGAGKDKLLGGPGKKDRVKGGGGKDVEKP